MEIINIDDNTQVITNYTTEPDLTTMTLRQALDYINVQSLCFDKIRAIRRQERRRFRFAI